MKQAKERKTCVNALGYEVVWLGDRLHLVHRLLAEQHIPNPKNLPFVNHIDGDKLNNNLKNLEWVTPGDNVRHAHKIGLMNPLRGAGTRPWCHKPVYDNFGNHFESISSASVETGICLSSIMSCLSKRYKSAGGRVWNYA